MVFYIVRVVLYYKWKVLQLPVRIEDLSEKDFEPDNLALIWRVVVRMILRLRGGDSVPLLRGDAKF